MKNYIMFLGVLIGLGAVSCEEYENSAEPSQITYLPAIELNGDQIVALDCSASGYTDPGATATEGGEPISVTVDVGGVYFGSSDINIPDYYQINYSAVNVDGIPGAEIREVILPSCNSDFVTGIEGMYTASVFRTRTSSGATVDFTAEEFGPYWVADMGGGKYGFSCVIGQFYEYGYGYGPAYTGTGLVIQANDIASNNFSVVATNGVGAFGGDIEVSNFSIDPVSKTISWSATWSRGYIFDVVLTQTP